MFSGESGNISNTSNSKTQDLTCSQTNIYSDTFNISHYHSLLTLVKNIVIKYAKNSELNSVQTNSSW